MKNTRVRKGRRKAPLSPWRSANSQKAIKAKKPIEGVASLDHRFGIPMIAPFFIIFLIFGMAPVIYSIYISFYKWDPLGGSTFNGFETLLAFGLSQLSPRWRWRLA